MFDNRGALTFSRVIAVLALMLAAWFVYEVHRYVERGRHSIRSSIPRYRIERDTGRIERLSVDDGGKWRDFEPKPHAAPPALITGPTAPSPRSSDPE